MGLVVARCRGDDATSSRPAGSRSTTPGQLFLEEYYTLSLDRPGGRRHQPPRRQHPALHRDRLAGAARDVRLRRPAVLATPTWTSTDCLFLVGSNMAETQTVLWARVLDRLAGPEAAAAGRRRPARARRPRRRPTSTSARGSGRTSPLLNGLLHLLIEDGHVDRGVRRQAHASASTSLARDGRRTTRRERVEEITGVPAAEAREAARTDRHGEDARVVRAPGGVPVEPGDRGGVPGEQRQPRPRAGSAGRGAA